WRASSAAVMALVLDATLNRVSRVMARPLPATASPRSSTWRTSPATTTPTAMPGSPQRATASSTAAAIAGDGARAAAGSGADATGKTTAGDRAAATRPVRGGTEAL